MKSPVLMLLAALVFASSARAQPQCNAHFTTPCPGGFDFRSLICNMKSYDPIKFNPHMTPDSQYTPPMCDSANVPAQNLKDRLKDAYDLAPASVKAKLCKLDQVFVTTDSSYTTSAREPLGIWEAPARGGKVYIAIPDHILTSASSLADEENGILARLLTDPKAPGRSLPSFRSNNAPAKTPAAAILAVLAHELGHILLADGNLDGAGASHPRPCSAPKDTCFLHNFLGPPNGTTLWNRAHFHRNMRRWVGFGATNGNTYLNTDVNFSAIKNQINDPTRDMDSTARVRKIYLAGLASVFAAVSPEEDFVETYKYKVLAAARDSSGASIDLSLDYPSGSPTTIDVLSPLRTPAGDLGRKISCVP